MGDPELRSDESVILRTDGIFVKSIPFEGILTNKRIILVDRAKNLLPNKEIPLVTIKDVGAGENAIRDQIITLSVLSRSGETRQMILTFSRQTGGNRIRERDAWARALKENITSTFEQVIRKVVPGRETVKKPDPVVRPRVQVSPPVSSPGPRPIKPTAKKETERHPPVKIMETTPVQSSPGMKGSEAPVSGFGTYCSRCGNRVPEGSVFCNRCGSPIVAPGSMPAVKSAVKVPTPPKPETAAGTIPPDQVLPSRESSPDRQESLIDTVIREAPWQQEAPEEPAPFTPVGESGYQEPDSGAVQADEEPEFKMPDITASQVSESISIAGDLPPPKPLGSGLNIKPGRNAIYAGIVIFLIIVAIAGGFFIYPLISKGGLTAANTTSVPTTPPVTQAPSGILTPKVTPVVTVPAEGVYVHIKYLGSFKGTYGIPSDLSTVTSSGDRYYPVENATGIVQASIAKSDPTTRQSLLVEILRDARVLTSGTTTAGFGKVTLSVDIVTGVAKDPEIGTSAVVSTTTKTQTNQT